MRLMIVGELDGTLAEAGRIAHGRGAKVAHIPSTQAALAALRNGKGADLLMVEVRQDLAGFIQALDEERFHVPVVACGIGTDAQAAVRAIRAGAKEYVPLPPDATLIAAVLEAVAEESHAIVSRDPAMTKVLKLAERVAMSDASVLVNGESGTGKELMARFLHRKSRRAEKPFIALNCAAIPEQLLESELFGHEKGAFTGAVARRLGKFEEAQGGTLLLDEVTEMDMRLQSKLLRALQEREIDRVGGTAPVKIDIRVVATSNRDMAQAVQSGIFREDLYHRLNVVTLRLPPLRERPMDVALLAEHFVKKYAEENGRIGMLLTDDTLELMARQPWPGNVRELENTMHRAVLMSAEHAITPEDVWMSDGRSLAEHSPTPATKPAVATAAPGPAGIVNRQPEPAQLEPVLSEDATMLAIAAAAGQSPVRKLVGRTVADVERDLIIDTLHHCLGNRTHAATILGISIRTLRNKLKQYSDEGVPVPMPMGHEAAGEMGF